MYRANAAAVAAADADCGATHVWCCRYFCCYCRYFFCCCCCCWSAKCECTSGLDDATQHVHYGILSDTKFRFSGARYDSLCVCICVCVCGVCVCAAAVACCAISIRICQLIICLYFSFLYFFSFFLFFYRNMWHRERRSTRLSLHECVCLCTFNVLRVYIKRKFM